MHIHPCLFRIQTAECQGDRSWLWGAGAWYFQELLLLLLRLLTIIVPNQRAAAGMHIGPFLFVFGKQNVKVVDPCQQSAAAGAWHSYLYYL